MSYNLSLLPPAEKNKVELDKQASYVVWQLKEAKVGPDAIRTQLENIRDEAEKAWFEQCVAKYKKMMGVL
ncbi:MULTISPECIES: DUF3283 family protein [Vibrio]|uniref:DUF3283 family protein n=1 Tax=Vibrio qingdaonensis TaxID=2829491 RepID=A0A9X3CPG2_9VIBR|nr:MULTISPECIES: DUF3283 family protein [Vibrio]MCL9775233.1 DUF3283 family protein [Vibrio methylphosphonaticus]MCW8347148.1 DUF3283 family protein [Vibrio qingdaonensis]